MEKEKGFTLIELLAVIVILAIIAVIATPLTINVINSAKEKSFINTVYGLIDGARLLSAEQLIDGGTKEVVVNFNGGAIDNSNFNVSGDLPESGTVYLSSDGKIEVKVWSEELGKCAEKTVTESNVRLTETTKEKCKLEVKENTLIGQTVTEVMEEKIESGEVIKDTTSDQNLRYVGQSPNNYVYFNKDGAGNPEKWRIIGVFNGQTKIIRNDYYELNGSTGIAWDYNSDGSYLNNWATASINELFNDKSTGYVNVIKTNDETSYNYIDLTHVWNIGGTGNFSSSKRLDFYKAERSETPAGAEGSNYIWEGAIGLMYLSDYAYASSGATETCDGTAVWQWYNEPAQTECVKNSWLYDGSNNQWTLTPNSSAVDNVLGVNTDGYVFPCSANGGDYGARPVLYLKSNVKIMGGKGTDQEPYILGV